MAENKKDARELQKLIKAGSLVLQVSLSAVCPIILLLFAGIWLDGKYGNGGHWFAALGILMGIYSAYRSTYYMIRDGFMDKKEETDYEISPESDQ